MCVPFGTRKRWRSQIIISPLGSKYLETMNEQSESRIDIRPFSDKPTSSSSLLIINVDPKWTIFLMWIVGRFCRFLGYKYMHSFLSQLSYWLIVPIEFGESGKMTKEASKDALQQKKLPVAKSDKTENNNLIFGPKLWPILDILPLVKLNWKLSPKSSTICHREKSE